MNSAYRSAMNEPAIYRIRVSGCVSERWVSRFWSMQSKIVQREAATTTTEMIGATTDQECLIRLLNPLYDMGHVLISLGLLTADQIEGETLEESDS